MALPFGDIVSFDIIYVFIEAEWLEMAYSQN